MFSGSENIRTKSNRICVTWKERRHFSLLCRDSNSQQSFQWGHFYPGFISKNNYPFLSIPITQELMKTTTFRGAAFPEWTLLYKYQGVAKFISISKCFENAFQQGFHPLTLLQNTQCKKNASMKHTFLLSSPNDTFLIGVCLCLFLIFFM